MNYAREGALLVNRLRESARVLAARGMAEARIEALNGDDVLFLRAEMGDRFVQFRFRLPLNISPQNLAEFFGGAMEQFNRAHLGWLIEGANYDIDEEGQA